eukprot:COSAG01_NODE_58197_length_307_cov_1.240385_2_plen_20_part_01
MLDECDGHCEVGVATLYKSS